MPLTVPQNFSDVVEYRKVFLKRKWTILLCTTLVLLFTVVRVSDEVPQYRAKSRLLVSYQPPNALDVENILGRFPLQGSNASPDVTALLSSRQLAKRVIRKLDLFQSDEFKEKPTRTVRDYIKMLTPDPLEQKIRKALGKGDPADVPAPDGQSEIPSWFVDRYTRRIRINPVGQSNLIEISFQGKDPEEIARILNAHVQEFIEMDLHLRFGTSEETQFWIEEKIQEAKRDYERAWLRSVQYIEDNPILKLGPDIFGTLISQGLKEDYLGLEKMRYERLQTEKQLDLIKKFQNDYRIVELFPQLGEKGGFASLSNELDKLSVEYSRLSKDYGPEHPKMVQIRSQMGTIKETLRAESQKALQRLRLIYQHQLEMEKDLTARLQEKQGEMVKLGKTQSEYKTMAQEAEASLDAYRAILEKSNAAKLLGNADNSQLMSSIKVIDKAEVPTLTLGSNKSKKIGTSAIMGFLLGIFACLVLELMDNVIRTPKDVQGFFKLPLLGSFPLISASSLEDPKVDISSQFLTVATPKTPQAESVRNIRTNLIFSFADRKNHAILFTSPNPDEGKSTVASNLAVSIAQLGKRILLVDADLRKPTLHKLFRFENLSGMSDVLIGEATVDEVVRATEIPRLDLLTSGTLPPNPSELLGSESMRDLLEQIKSRYEVILFDTPPVLPVVDSKILGQLMDGVCLVARSQRTTLPSMKHTLQQLEENEIRILGIVLNEVDFSVEGSPYGYTYSYYQRDPEDEDELTPPFNASA